MMIHVNGLTKQFRASVQKQGRFGALRTLLSRDYTVKEAVCDISIPDMPERYFEKAAWPPAQAESDAAPSGGPDSAVGSGLRLAGRDGNTLTVECNRDRLSAMEALRLLERLGEIADVHMEEPDFEEIVHRIY